MTVSYSTDLSRLEPYSVRPTPEQVVANPELDLGLNWQQTKQAIASALGVWVSDALDSNPPATLYFYGRDAEPFYDLAHSLGITERYGIPIKLFNVSRASSKDPKLSQYLSEQGLNETELKQRQAILIDTGWRGRLQDTTLEAIPQSVRSNVKVRLLLSTNAKYPSHRQFFVDVTGGSAYPEKILETIKLLTQFELIPHQTSSARGYHEVNGKLEPVSHKKRPSNSKLRYWREDIKHYGSSKEAKALFISSLRKQKQLRRSVKSSDVATIAANMTTRASQRDPIILDYLDKLDSDHTRGVKLPKNQIKFLELVQIPSRTELIDIKNFEEQRRNIANRFPELAKYMTSDNEGAAALVSQKDWASLEKLIEQSVDKTFLTTVSHYVGELELTDDPGFQKIMKYVFDSPFFRFANASHLIFHDSIVERYLPQLIAKIGKEKKISGHYLALALGMPKWLESAHAPKLMSFLYDSFLQNINKKQHQEIERVASTLVRTYLSQKTSAADKAKTFEYMKKMSVDHKAARNLFDKFLTFSRHFPTKEEFQFLGKTAQAGSKLLPAFIALLTKDKDTFFDNKDIVKKVFELTELSQPDLRRAISHPYFSDLPEDMIDSFLSKVHSFVLSDSHFSVGYNVDFILKLKDPKRKKAIQSVVSSFNQYPEKQSSYLLYVRQFIEKGATRKEIKILASITSIKELTADSLKKFSKDPIFEPFLEDLKKNKIVKDTFSDHIKNARRRRERNGNLSTSSGLLRHPENKEMDEFLEHFRSKLDDASKSTKGSRLSFLVDSLPTNRSPVSIRDLLIIDDTYKPMIEEALDLMKRPDFKKDFDTLISGRLKQKIQTTRSLDPIELVAWIFRYGTQEHIDILLDVLDESKVSARVFYSLAFRSTTIDNPAIDRSKINKRIVQMYWEKSMKKAGVFTKETKDIFLDLPPELGSRFLATQRIFAQQIPRVATAENWKKIDPPPIAPIFDQMRFNLLDRKNLSPEFIEAVLDTFEKTDEGKAHLKSIAENFTKHSLTPEKTRQMILTRVGCSTRDNLLGKLDPDP